MKSFFAASLSTVTALLSSSWSFTQTVDELRAAAVEHVYRKQYAEAEALFTKILEINPNDNISYLDRGLVRESQFRLNDAINDFTQQIAVDSSAPDGWFLRGILLQKTGDTLNAMEDFKRVIELDFYNSDAHLFLGQGFEFTGNSYAADTCYRNALLANPENVTVLDYWIPLALMGGNLHAFDSLKQLRFTLAPDQLNTHYWAVLRNGLLKEVSPVKVRENALAAGMNISGKQLVEQELAPEKWSTPWLNALLKPVFSDAKKDSVYLPAAIRTALLFRANESVGKALKRMKKMKSRETEYLQLSAVYFAQEGKWKQVSDRIEALGSRRELLAGELLLLSKAQLETGNIQASCSTYRLYLSATDQPVFYPFCKHCRLP